MGRDTRIGIWGFGAAIAAILWFAASPAFAADLSPSAGSKDEVAGPLSGWSVSFTPYGWLTFLDGSVTVKDRTADLNVNPITVIEHLERMPWFSYLEARKGPVSFYNDLIYANLGGVSSGVKSLDRIDVTINGSAKLDSTMAIAELGGTYELARWATGESLKDPNVPASFTAIDVLAGARYWYQSAALNLAVSGAVPPDLTPTAGGAIARSGTVDWVDPLAGLRLRHEFEPGRELILIADIGGFGAGSQFSWNAMAAYRIEFASNNGYTYSGIIGYRALQADYVQGEGRTRYEWDVVQHGPIIGLSVGF